MYGMVNRAIEDLVLQHHGPEAWREIKEAADVDVEAFVSMQPYPDAMTYALVGAAAQRLGVPAENLLRTFGHYWVEFAAEHGYGDLLGGPGTDLATFLRGLDAMHARIALSFEALQPPSFRCTSDGPGALTLDYHSHRPGLAPFVVGLIEGLARRFGTTASVAHAARKDDGAPHDVFHVRWTTP